MRSKFSFKIVIKIPLLREVEVELQALHCQSESQAIGRLTHPAYKYSLVNCTIIHQIKNMLYEVITFGDVLDNS